MEQFLQAGMERYIVESRRRQSFAALNEEDPELAHALAWMEERPTLWCAHSEHQDNLVVAIS